MLIPFGRFKAAYELIQQRALDSGCRYVAVRRPRCAAHPLRAARALAWLAVGRLLCDCH